MTPETDQIVKQLFSEASELTGLERECLLNEKCAGDPRLRDAVQRLLSADDGKESRFLDGLPSPTPTGVLPARVGRFRLLRKIGEGGMGTVFEAEQDHPRRTVALKMVRLAGLSESVLRRFDHEVQILGQLRHPGIAQIHEAGTHDDGLGTVPYFAMELVHGRPLLEFARSHRLSTHQRLDLMASICDAVHYAHQQGVIHRDLKPANVLIEQSADGRFQPKILDFGVARITGCDMDLATMHTGAGQLIGTLSYMSPEQVAGNPNDVDKRSDVYALGVLLYELLADRLPYELRERSIADAGTVIREQEPSRLSSIDTRFRGDIETIVAKALAKEKERRYQSAAELSGDLRRFLRDEPIMARPPSKAYAVRKFARRNKGLVGGVAAAFTALLFAVVGISIALYRATHAEKAALASAAKATAISNFLQDMLAGIDPENIGPGPLTVREVLDHASARLERELGHEPEVAAPIHQTLGNHYKTLGLYFEADTHLKTAVDLRRSLATSDDPELASALSDMAANLQEKRDIIEAEAPTREALEIRRRLFGNDSVEVANSLYDLASILVEIGELQEAEAFARESLDIRRRLLGPQSEAVAISTGLLGWCFLIMGRLDEAEAAMQEAVDMVRRLPGDNERALASRLTFLAHVLRAKGDDARFEAALREAIEIRTRRLAEDHPALAWNLLNLAQIRRKLGDLDEAESAGRRALEIYQKKRGPQHTDVADCMQLLAQVYDDRGRYEEAQAWWNACLEIRHIVRPPGHVETVFAENALAASRLAGSNSAAASADKKNP